MQRSQLSCYLTENQQATSSEKKVSPLFHFTKDLKHWNYLSGTQRTGRLEPLSYILNFLMRPSLQKHFVMFKFGLVPIKELHFLIAPCN